MPIQKCPMCLRITEVVSSHLIPRKVYEYCRTADKSPFALSSKWQGYTDRQTQDYLLCLDCERNLNEGGEDWPPPLLAVYDGPFPFFDILNKVQATAVDDGAVVFAAAPNPE